MTTTLKRYIRYFRRTLFEHDRIGSVAGGKDSVKWDMVSWIWKTRDASKYRRWATESGLPMVVCHSMAEVNALYDAWGLERR